MKKILVLTTTLSLLALSFASEATLKLKKVSNNDLNITVSSNKDVYGLQFDVVCDSKITSETVTNAFSNNDPRSNMEVHSRLREDGSVRVIMFDLTGQAIVTSQNAEEVLNLNLNGDSAKMNCSCENMVVAGKNGQSIESNSTFEEVALPSETKIVGNYPNPFNPSTTIEFDLAAENAGNIEIVIYDLQGRQVETLFSGMLEAGAGQKFQWNATSVASGKYFAVVSAPNGFTDTVNMTLIK
tara:strand:- start:48 stop:770 length:723 start_codon:yes stop_codon:yes gene_type:complete